MNTIFEKQVNADTKLMVLVEGIETTTFTYNAFVVEMKRNENGDWQKTQTIKQDTLDEAIKMYADMIRTF